MSLRFEILCFVEKVNMIEMLLITCLAIIMMYNLSLKKNQSLQIVRATLGI